MSTSLRSGRGTGRLARSMRAAIVLASMVAVGSSTSAVGALGSSRRDPTPPIAPVVALPAVVATLPTPAAVSVDESPTRSAAECARYPEGFCNEVPLHPEPMAANPDTTPSCRNPGPHSPTGTTAVVEGHHEPTAASRIMRFRVEVEEGLAVDAECFAAAVTAVLADPRGWAGTGSLTFERVDDDSFDFRLILASPDTTNALCYPAATAGKYSCRNRDRVVLNLMRWEAGTDEFKGDLSTYRRYLVNHEVGHLLGHGHTSCSQPEAPAPVMMQQTKGLGDCSPNGWPTDDER